MDPNTQNTSPDTQNIHKAVQFYMQVNVNPTYPCIFIYSNIFSYIFLWFHRRLPRPNGSSKWKQTWEPHTSHPMHVPCGMALGGDIVEAWQPVPPIWSSSLVFVGRRIGNIKFDDCAVGGDADWERLPYDEGKENKGLLAWTMMVICLCCVCLCLSVSVFFCVCLCLCLSVSVSAWQRNAAFDSARDSIGRYGRIC